MNNYDNAIYSDFIPIEVKSDRKTPIQQYKLFNLINYKLNSQPSLFQTLFNFRVPWPKVEKKKILNLHTKIEFKIGNYTKKR